jgi:4-amino-4-deoxy-L-arabinose transferase-like glycosyltransferase
MTISPTTIQPRAAVADRNGTALLVVLALVVAGIHTLLNGNYGFHRDELATLDDARHLTWGYVAYPPLTPAIGHLELSLFGTALAGFRVFAALAFAASMVLTGLMARQFGASRQTQLFASVVVAFAPIALMGSSLFQYVAFDYLGWVAISYCVVRLLDSQDDRWWLAIGAVIGMSLLTKYTVLVWVAGLGVGTLLTPARRSLANRWPWLGAAICLLLFLPNLWWQWQHDFISLDFLRHIHERDVAIGRTDGFIKDQFLIAANPVAIPLWLAGLYFLLLDANGKRYRLLGWMFITTLVLLLMLRGRAYYFAPAYPVLIAAGSVMWQRGIRHLRGGVATWAAGASWTLLLAAGIALGSLLVPVAPLHSALWEISAKMHDDFREQIGWPNLAQTVSTLYTAMPEDEKAGVRVLAANYGEAGALNLYRDRYPLPPVISAVNSYWLAGYGEPPPQQLIVLGYSKERLAQLFEDCQLATTIVNRDGVDNEESRDHPDVYLCRGPREPWSTLWQHMRHYG